MERGGLGIGLVVDDGSIFTCAVSGPIDDGAIGALIDLQGDGAAADSGAACHRISTSG